MKTIISTLVTAGARLVMDFMGGVHVAPVVDYIQRLVTCSTLADVVQTARSVDIHLIASVALCMELAHSLYEQRRNGKR